MDVSAAAVFYKMECYIENKANNVQISWFKYIYYIYIWEQIIDFKHFEENKKNNQ